MIQSKLISARHRIRVQLFFWTSVLLLIAIGGPLELSLRIGARFLQDDLVDRTTAVVSDVAANLGTAAALEETEVERQLLTESLRAPSIVELSVVEARPGGEPRILASTVNRPDYATGKPGPISLEGRSVVGSDGQRILVLGRDVPNHAGVSVVAATTFQDLDRFYSLNRSTAFIVTFASIAVAVLMLNYIFHRKIGKPLESILGVMAYARTGDYTRRLEVREDEMGQVAATFNDLLERVEMRDEDLQERVAIATRGLLDTQSRLIQAEKLATAGQMATTFAHEIGSPLTSLSAHAELLLEDPETTRHQKEAIALMHKQIRRVTEIVDDLLRSARHGPEDFVIVNVADIANDVLKLVLPRLRAQNIHVVNQLPDGLHIRGYALYLQEMFLNLINNSAEAIERDGAIELAGGTDRGGKVWLEIRDNGPGVDPRIIDDVWKRFVTSKAMRNGTGIGLAVVREIVKQHGGEVSLQTSAAGTIVRVVLPSLKPAALSI